MKNNRRLTAAVLLIASAWLSGCASPDTSATVSTPAASSTMSMTPGRGAEHGPLATSRMVCGPEIRGIVGRLFAMSPAPEGTATWVDHLYTCTYQGPVGPLVLSVKESPNAAAAHGYLRSVRERLSPTQPLVGLANFGLPSFETTAGTVVFLKDNSTLMVDATKVRPSADQQYTSRLDLAYEVASDVIGCWSEH